MPLLIDFNNFINPAYVKKSGETWADDELQRLYDLGETGVFPQKAAQDTKINGEYLSADEYVTYAKERGSTSLKGVQELISSSAYKNMSDADKAAAIQNVYAYADGVADLLEKTQSANIDDNIALDVYEFKEASNNDINADGKVTKSVKDKVKEYIGSLSIPAEQKNALYYSFYKKW